MTASQVADTPTVTEKHRERALKFLAEYVSGKSGAPQLVELFATVEAEALERASQWHDTRAALPKDDEFTELAANLHSMSAAAIRGLK